MIDGADGYAKLEKQLQHDEDCLMMAFGLPAALVKAMGDPFDYACGLRNGMVLYFSDATWEHGSPWVHLTIHEIHGNRTRVADAPLFERGIDVRLSEIAWVADAPFGS